MKRYARWTVYAPPLPPAPDLFELGAGLGVGWMDDGFCRQLDPEIFFPDAGVPPAKARWACHQCSVRVECAAWALVEDIPEGMFGGLTARERRGMRAVERQRQAAAGAVRVA